MQVTRPVPFPCCGVLSKEKHVLLPSVADVVVEQGRRGIKRWNHIKDSDKSNMLYLVFKSRKILIKYLYTTGNAQTCFGFKLIGYISY